MTKDADGKLTVPLSAGKQTLLGRIENGRLLIDPRTLAEDELEAVAEAVAAART